MSDSPDLFSDLVFAQLRLTDVVERSLRAAGGPEVSSYLPLLVAERLGGARVQDVARELGISVGGASKAIDRLEQAGWVKRKAHPEDRRSSTVVVTAAGRRTLSKASTVVAHAVDEAMTVPATRRTQLATALGQLRVALRG